MSAPRETQRRANGIRFACLEAGAGPAVLLLHGYPDNAWTWRHQLPALAAAGFHAVAPFLRGYPPTEVPARGWYDRATLAQDVAALCDDVGGGAPVMLVAQDWGAAIAYGVLGAFPEKVRRAVLLAVPHPVAVRRTLRRSPKHVLRSFHWFLFQLPALPELLCRARDFAFVEFLWWLWSPHWGSAEDQEHLARVKAMLRQPGAVEAGLAYYRALTRPSLQDPALAAVRARLDARIGVPTRVLFGRRDLRREMVGAQREFFTGEYDAQLVDDAGHFLHRERPAAVNPLILEWLRS